MAWVECLPGVGRVGRGWGLNPYMCQGLKEGKKLEQEKKEGKRHTILSFLTSRLQTYILLQIINVKKYI